MLHQPLQKMSSYEQPPIIDFEGGVTVLTRQPSVMAELYQNFYPGEVDFVGACLSGSCKPRTHNERQRLAKALSAIEILNLLYSQRNG